MKGADEVGDGCAVHEEWPPDGLEDVHACPVCCAVKKTVLYSGLTDRTFFCSPGRWTLYQCDVCRCAYLSPRPSRSTINIAYRKYYTHEVHSRSDTTGLAGLRLIRRKLANGYLNWRYGASFAPSSRLGVIAAALMPSYRELLDFQGRHLPKAAPGGRLLDVGFGNGRFLELARSMGWNVAGVDPDPVAVRNASEDAFEVRLGGIEAYCDQSEAFDVITLNHVIEHLHDPRSALLHALRMLKPGGRLWLETPNIESVGHARFRESWRGLEIPRHLVLFSWRSLEALLIECGFSRVERKPRYGLYPEMAMASRAVRDALGPGCLHGPSVIERVQGVDASLRSRFDYRKTEVIALVAYKEPVDGGA